MAVYRDSGMVLRTHPLGESDRIVTLLTREHGKVRTVAKGVRRTTSRFGARLEPFMWVDVQLATGRTFDVVAQAELAGAYGQAICADYERFTVGQVMLETADRLVAAEQEPALAHFQLLLGAVHALAERAHAPGLLLDSYLLRALAVAGWAPSFVDCARCGAPGPHRAFNAPMGGAVCAACRPPGSTAPAPETFGLLAALLSGDWAVADASEARHRTQARGLVAAYSQYHVEQRLRSLPMVERV